MVNFTVLFLLFFLRGADVVLKLVRILSNVVVRSNQTSHCFLSKGCSKDPGAHGDIFKMCMQPLFTSACLIYMREILPL